MTDSTGEDQVKTFAYIDLDGFSEINNEHGHSFGDEVLDQIEDFGHDFVGDRGEFDRKYGQGDEFLIKLPDIHKDKAEELMENFRQQLEELEPNDVTVTASIGIASLPEDGEDEEEMIEAADQAMLNSENWGGNQVSVSGQETETEEIEVWFEDFMRIDEDDLITIEMWLGDLPDLRAAQIYNETQDISNESRTANTVMVATKYEDPISGIVTDIVAVDSSETRFNMRVERSRLEELDLL